MLLVFALTLFCSATLLFIIEPMVGKMMLPLLGGTPAVWNTCMVFFQAVLLAGYGYAHVTTTWLGARRQARLQLAVLALPLVSIVLNGLYFSGMLSPNERLILGQESNPIPALLLVLTLSVGLPMLVVCTSAPLLQRWFSSTDHPAAQDPYFLYGASNLGSMLSLIGYPLVVEPYLSLRGQQTIWVIGYGVLSLLVAVCAVLMWKSRPALEPATTTVEPAGEIPGTGHIQKGQSRTGPDLSAFSTQEAPLSDQPVTWLTRMRWTVLAVIPSSLMLGVTTYITTDIAAIPLLWVLPLTLYLLTFIIVFAKIPPRVQAVVTLASLAALVLTMVIWVLPLFVKDESMLWLVRLIGLALLAFSVGILRQADRHLIHRVMIMAMPLIVLLLIFMMLSEIKPGVLGNIAVHLATLFVVSMVCHGELARERPAPQYLTEFFLLMSVGGVLGGLFNALFAPVAFNSLVEYPLMMMVACLLLPPLGLARDEGGWARRADVALAVVFFAVGGLLVYLRWRDPETAPDLGPLGQGAWRWGLAALLGGTAVGLVAAWQGWSSPSVDGPKQEPDHPLDRVLDLLLPATLFVLVLGLYWGLPAKGVVERLGGFAEMVGMDVRQFRVILTFGLPAVLCYTFVERSVRFGLGVGALLLAGGYSSMIDDSPLYQQRSFFGVLRVESGWTDWPARGQAEYRYFNRRLVHGTTLHGKQFLEPELRDTPLSYYHRTGPVGQVFRAYNTDARRPMAVIGLGTGTMACYGMPGQTLDFYDIDPVVVDISYDTNGFFTFVEDAETRGVDVNLVLGDARLTFKPDAIKKRMKPLHKRKDEPTPQRRPAADIPQDFKYGLIVVDAFSSDAIPIHLITREAVNIYFDRMLEDGILLMHISNRYLDLQPVLANISADLGVVGYHLSDDDNAAAGKNRSHWVALARKTTYLDRVLTARRWERDADQQALLGAALWPAAGPCLSTTCGLAYAFQGIAEAAATEKARGQRSPYQPGIVATDWKPLETQTELRRRLDEASTEEDRQKAQEKVRVNARVGVWTDDYSNLLSVFNW